MVYLLQATAALHAIVAWRRGDLMSVKQRLSGGTTQIDGQACNFVKAAPTGVLWSAP